jgi:hypothetical protein
MSTPIILSLGAGVQSTTLLLMALHGELEQIPNCAIFADTGGAEPERVFANAKSSRHHECLEFFVYGFRFNYVNSY